MPRPDGVNSLLRPRSDSSKPTVVWRRIPIAGCRRRIGLIFDKVEETGSVRQALLWFLEHGLDLPARRPDGTIVWRRQRYSTLHQIIDNPAYGGAYAYGKTGATPCYDGSGASARVRRKAVMSHPMLKSAR